VQQPRQSILVANPRTGLPLQTPHSGRETFIRYAPLKREIMKKTLFVLLIIFVPILYCFSKTKTEIEYNENGVVLKSTVYTYDENSNLIIITPYNANKNESKSIVYTYKDNRIIKEESYFLNKKTNNQTHINYVYIKDKLKKKMYYAGSRLYQVEMFKYNLKGLLEKEVMENFDVPITTTTSYEYDDKNNLTKETVYDFKSYQYSFTHEYNNQNQKVITVADYKVQGTFRFTFEYNSSGTIDVEKQFDDHSDIETITKYEYNEVDQLSKIVVMQDGTVLKYTEFLYTL
jgi:hypothetical protein